MQVWSLTHCSSSIRQQSLNSGLHHLKNQKILVPESNVFWNRPIPSWYLYTLYIVSDGQGTCQSCTSRFKQLLWAVQPDTNWHMEERKTLWSRPLGRIYRLGHRPKDSRSGTTNCLLFHMFLSLIDRTHSLSLSPLAWTPSRLEPCSHSLTSGCHIGCYK